MARAGRRILPFVSALPLAGSLASCAISLTPAYDAGLVEALSSANRGALLLFAQLDDDAAKATYPARADRYARAISELEDLQQRAKTRAVPPLARRLARSRLFQRVCPGGDPEACLNASPDSIQRADDVLTRMRDEDKGGGLDRGKLKLFKLDYKTAIEQAMTVESALKQ